MLKLKKRRVVALPSLYSTTQLMEQMGNMQLDSVFSKDTKFVIFYVYRIDLFFNESWAKCGNVGLYYLTSLGKDRRESNGENR